MHEHAPSPQEVARAMKLRSVVSHDMPDWAQIPQVPVIHPVWKTKTAEIVVKQPPPFMPNPNLKEKGHQESCVSEAAPDWMHIKGLPKKPYRKPEPLSVKVSFENAEYCCFWAKAPYQLPLQARTSQAARRSGAQTRVHGLWSFKICFPPQCRICQSARFFPRRKCSQGKGCRIPSSKRGAHAKHAPNHQWRRARAPKKLEKVYLKRLIRYACMDENISNPHREWACARHNR